MTTKTTSTLIKKLDFKSLEGKNDLDKYNHQYTYSPKKRESFGCNTTIEKDNISDENKPEGKNSINILSQRTNFQNLSSIRKWHILINTVRTVRNLSKFKIQPLSIENFDSVFEPMKKGKKTERTDITIKKEEKIIDSQMDYITDQIQLFQLIEYGYDKKEDKIIELIKKHNFVNDMNYKKYTPLYAACLNGYSKIAKILIDNGADPLKLSCENESVLDVAVRMNYVNLVEFLLEYYSKWPINYLQKAKSLIVNSEINKIFRKYERKNIKECCCFTK